MTEYHGVEGHSNLLRDPDTDSIVNIDSLGYERYIARREAKNKKNQKNKRIQNLKFDFRQVNFVA